MVKFQMHFWDLLLNQNKSQREHVPLGQLLIVKRRSVFTDSVVDPCCRAFLGPYLADESNWTNPFLKDQVPNEPHCILLPK